LRKHKAQAVKKGRKESKERGEENKWKQRERERERAREREGGKVRGRAGRNPAGYDPANEPENANQSHDAGLEIVHLRSNAAIPFPGLCCMCQDERQEGRMGSGALVVSRYRHRRTAHGMLP